MRKRFTHCLAFAAVMLLNCVGIFAQPANASRVLRTIDFEERRLGNTEELPMHWSKVVGAGLPHYVNGHLATDQAHSGKFSFRFDLNGGSLIYRYDAGQIPVSLGAHYHVETWVRTTVLANARARLTTYMVDADGHPFNDTIRKSDLYAATAENEPWKLLTIETADNEPRAASLVVELAVLQPAQYAGAPLGQRTLYDQDIQGSAWFDDVSVSQVPRVTITTDRPANIFRHNDPLQLHVDVSDRFTDDLSAQLVITDAVGRTIYQRSGAPELSKAERLGPGEKRMTMMLPALPTGWYQISLLMTSQGQRVGSRTMSIIRLADNADPFNPDGRFGVIATDLPFEGWSKLPELLSLLGVSRVKLAVWSSAGDVEQLDPLAFDQMLVRFEELRIQPTACLVNMPPSIVNILRARLQKQSSSLEPIKFDEKDWTLLLKAKSEDWQPQLAYLLARHAAHLDRWQLGEDGSDAFVVQPAMREVYNRVYAEFSKLIPQPDLAMPWPAWYELEGELPATIALSVPTSVLPSQLPLYIDDLHKRDRQHLSITLQILDRGVYGRKTQIRDLAQRVIYALSADANRIDIPLSFTVQREMDDYIDQPQEMFMIVRTLMRTLGNAKFRGRVPIAEGVESFLFDRDGQGILALWNTGHGGPAMQSLAINLGDRPARLDLWGNLTPLMHPRADQDSVRVDVGSDDLPIFIVGVDANMLKLRASVALDHPLVESSFKPHTRHLLFTNPYKQAVTGSVRLHAPQGWNLVPTSFNFSLNPGETFDRELTIEFPYNSFAGVKTLQAQFDVQSDRATSFTMPITLQLGLSDVGMQTTAIRNGNDVIVQQVVQNYGDKPIDYTAFAILPGQSRQERLITNLGAGRTTIKRYRFTNIDPKSTSKVRVGIKEIEGTRILNDEVDVQ